MAWLFWASLCLLAYTFAGYQVLISFLARLRRRPPPAPASPSERVTAIIVAHNEESRIARRIENLVSSDSQVEVVVCSDGSNDATVEEARLAGARVLDFPNRRGKAACLSDAILAVDTGIVVLTDSRQQFTSMTVPRLLRHFEDPAVGAVSGILRIGDPRTSTGAGVDLYWKMETAIRQAESDFDSCVGCTGAVYAIRRALFQRLPEDTVLDDVVIPMSIAIAGHRVVYDGEAEAFDTQPLDPHTETRRKVRTLAGNFQMLFRYPAWLFPWTNRLAWQLVSHKYLRLLGPVLLAAVFACSVSLAWNPFYRACLEIQIVLYVLALIGLAIPALRMRLVSAPAGFFFLNLMTLLGFLRYLFGPRAGTWERASPGNRQAPG